MFWISFLIFFHTVFFYLSCLSIVPNGLRYRLGEHSEDLPMHYRLPLMCEVVRRFFRRALFKILNITWPRVIPLSRISGFLDEH